jgi:hypothetical protein
MSDELVNQLTLNFLISKHQLQKLNKKIKDDVSDKRSSEIVEWKDRIKELFDNLLVHNPPNDLLIDVKNAFDSFIDKSIYYFNSRNSAYSR